MKIAITCLILALAYAGIILLISSPVLSGMLFDAAGIDLYSATAHANSGILMIPFALLAAPILVKLEKGV